MISALGRGFTNIIFHFPQLAKVPQVDLTT